MALISASLSIPLQRLLFNESDDPTIQGDNAVKISEFISSINTDFLDIKNVTIYTDNPFLVTDSRNIIYLDDIEKSDWMYALYDVKDHNHWIIRNDNASNRLSLVRTLRNHEVSSSVSSFLGYLEIDFDMNSFFHKSMI